MRLRYIENEQGEKILQQHCYSYKFKKGFGDYTHFVSLKKMKHDPSLTLKEMIWVDVPTIKQSNKIGEL